MDGKTSDLQETLLPRAKSGWALPEPALIGDEGQWYMIRGHIPVEIAVAAFVTDLAKTIGVKDTYDMYLGNGLYSLDTLAYGSDVKHTYVVERLLQEGDERVSEVQIGEPYIDLRYKNYPEEEWIEVTMWMTH